MISLCINILTFLNLLFLYAGGTASTPAPIIGKAHWTVGQVVKTTSGSIQGHAASLASEVSEYLGIPFAEPATGSLRFAAPKRYVWVGNITADKYSPDCPINITPVPPVTSNSSILEKLANASTDQSHHVFSEDCLSVNVWTKPQTGEPAKAVMLWIYGGGFTTGTSNSFGYNGALLADREDVVVVTFNYRVNFFGFASAPGLTTHNFGLLDQRMASEWVRDNIAAFGGDPSRITLFGQSAGGASVDLYSYAWTVLI